MGPDADPQAAGRRQAAMAEMLDGPERPAGQACPGPEHRGGLRPFMAKHGEMFPDDPQNVTS